jgi:hypothetical protein
MKRKTLEDITIDRGGPTKQFLSQFWDQIDVLAVQHDNLTTGCKHSIKLFSARSGGCSPTSDLDLDDAVAKAVAGEDNLDEVTKDLNDKIDSYYRVVGILIFRSIVGGYVISHKAMTRLWRNG